MNNFARQPNPRRTDDCAVEAMATWEPSGNHCLELAIVGTPISILLNREQAKQVSAAIEAFERSAIFEDGGPDRVHRKTQPLEFGDGR